MISGGGSGGRAIKVTPEDLTFENLFPNQEQKQNLVFKNTTSTAFELVI